MISIIYYVIWKDVVLKAIKRVVKEAIEEAYRERKSIEKKEGKRK
jgi:hypothetical protein